MRNKKIKIVSILAAVACLGAVTFTGCGEETYTGTKLPGYTSSQNAAESNGGFAVKKDGYVYFVNGMENYTAANEYGKVVKGSLMRISEENLNGGKYDKAETVVPMLFASQNMDSGIYIYGDYVYYATPTTDKDAQTSVVQNSWIDFKRAKLDGSEAMKGYYFRLPDNAAKYRFVQVNGVDENGDGQEDVFCMYEYSGESGTLRSFNTATGKDTVLVKGATAYYYDMQDLSNPTVYYTMGVTVGQDSDNSSTASYNQLYSVNAAAKVTALDSAKASYTTSSGKTYDFDEKYLAKQSNVKLDDYTTYPYVNLGKLVLDGVGSISHSHNGSVEYGGRSPFNGNTDTAPATLDGYKYEVKGYQNGGVYYTRTDVSDTKNVKLFYLADETGINGTSWNVVSGNAQATLVEDDTTNTASAIFYIDNGVHYYLYLSENGTLYRAGRNGNTEIEPFALTVKLAGATLWKVEGDYLYYYMAASNGNGFSRINCKGEEKDYNVLLGKEEYQPVTVDNVDWNSSWYKPEMFGDVLLFANEQSFGSTSYNYIYATKVGTTSEILARNEALKEVNDYMEEFTENADLRTAMKYYFRTGETAAFEAVRDEYDENQQTEFDKFVKMFDEGKEFEGKLESDFIAQVGVMKASDKEAIKTSWENTLRSPDVDENSEEEFPTWAICLIVCGSVVILACAAVAVLLVLRAKKAKAAEAEATVNAYKRKIDTTDDKSIDVYADEEETTETVEEAKEEVVEDTEEVVEEVVETEVPEVEEPASEEAEVPTEETENKEE